MAQLVHADSTVVRINEEGIQEGPKGIDFHSQESDMRNQIKEEEGDINPKLLEHQNDRFENKLIGKGLFEAADDALLVSNLGNKNQQVNQQSQKQKQSDEIPNQSQIRVGRKSRLPELKNLRRAASIAKLEQGEIDVNINRNSDEAIQSPNPLWKKTRLKWSQISSFADFIKDPIPKSKQFIGTLQRDREGLKRFFPLFSLYFANGMKYLLSSKRMSCKSTSTFNINSHIEELLDSDQFFLGALESNFFGTVYNLYDNEEGKAERQLLATICYENQLTFTSKPRNIEVYLLSPYYSLKQFEGLDKSKNLKELYEEMEGTQNRKILKLVNKKPKWSDKHSSWQLNFRGKMQMPSVKNMILVDAQTQANEALLIAKTGDHTFSMDVNYPLSPRVAMGVVNSSFDFKWVCQ